MNHQGGCALPHMQVRARRSVTIGWRSIASAGLMSEDNNMNKLLKAAVLAAAAASFVSTAFAEEGAKRPAFRISSSTGRGTSSALYFRILRLSAIACIIKHPAPTMPSPTSRACSSDR